MASITLNDLYISSNSSFVNCTVFKTSLVGLTIISCLSKSNINRTGFSPRFNNTFKNKASGGDILVLFFTIRLNSVLDSLVSL